MNDTIKGVLKIVVIIVAIVGVVAAFGFRQNMENKVYAEEHGYEYRYLIVGERQKAEDMEEQAILDYDYTDSTVKTEEVDPEEQAEMEAEKAKEEAYMDSMSSDGSGPYTCDEVEIIWGVEEIPSCHNLIEEGGIYEYSVSLLDGNYIYRMESDTYSLEWYYENGYYILTDKYNYNQYDGYSPF